MERGLPNVYRDGPWSTEYNSKGRVSYLPPFRCEVCAEKFERLVDLKEHLWVHTKESGYIQAAKDFDLCCKGIDYHRTQDRGGGLSHEGSSATTNLQVRRPTTSQKGSAPCGVCGKTFAFKNYLQIHQRVHTKEKPYSCDLCQKTFSQASSRNRHRKGMHKDQQGDSEDTPKVGPPCSVCGKIFPCRSLLSIHMRVHTKEKPYACDLCFRRYTQVSSRNFHRRRAHKDVPMTRATLSAPQSAMPISAPMNLVENQRNYDCKPNINVFS